MAEEIKIENTPNKAEIGEESMESVTGGALPAVIPLIVKGYKIYKTVKTAKEVYDAVTDKDGGESDGGGSTKNYTNNNSGGKQQSNQQGNKNQNSSKNNSIS